MSTRSSVGFVGSLIATLFISSKASADFIDYVGDTFNLGGRHQHDIVAVESALLPEGIRLRVSFVDSIAAPSAFAVNSLRGWIDLDMDSNPKTGGRAPWGLAMDQAGGNSWINRFIPPNLGTPAIPSPYNVLTNLGDELYVDLGSESSHAGSVDIFETSMNNVKATLPIKYLGNSFEIVLPHSVLEGDGHFHYGLLVGNIDGFLTDRGPNGDAAVIPEPSCLALIGIGSMILLGYSWRRRRPT